MLQSVLRRLEPKSNCDYLHELVVGSLILVETFHRRIVEMYEFCGAFSSGLRGLGSSRKERIVSTEGFDDQVDYFFDSVHGEVTIDQLGFIHLQQIFK